MEIERIKRILKFLSPRHRKIMELRWGFTDGKPHSLEDVGKEFSVTRERIRQIEAKAIEEINKIDEDDKYRCEQCKRNLIYNTCDCTSCIHFFSKK